jgi:hypothetical protein
VTDGDIWGKGRLTRKWYAVAAQAREDLEQGERWSAKRSDLTASALAESIRHADRQQLKEFASLFCTTRQHDLLTFEARWQSEINAASRRAEAELAYRAALVARERSANSSDTSEASQRHAFFRAFSEQGAHHLEAKIASDLPSALTDRQAEHFARQLAQDPESRIVAPRRVVPKKPTTQLLAETV